MKKGEAKAMVAVEAGGKSMVPVCSSWILEGKNIVIVCTKVSGSNAPGKTLMARYLLFVSFFTFGESVVHGG